MPGENHRILRSALLLMGVLAMTLLTLVATPQVASAQAGADEAVAWARQQGGRTDLEYWCDCFVSQAYGYDGSGHATANDHWMAIPWANSHPPEEPAPVGALVFYDTYPPYGHVAISTGGGNIISTNVNGAVGETGIGYFSGYRGWTDAMFPSAWGVRDGVCS